MIHPCDRQTDGQTDRRAIAYTRYSIYAVARKNSRRQSDAQTRTIILHIDNHNLNNESAILCESAMAV